MLPIREQITEVLEARRELEQATDLKLPLFSYPYGKRKHFTDETVRIVRDAGFAYACINESGIATVSTDRLRIPRLVVPPLDGPAFSVWLSHCFGSLF
jgi:peptidoglycan/xylan/chitin deacetylase (PgdA/CDA1 family)